MELGIQGDFWAQTPRSFLLHVDAARKAQLREIRNQVILAWNIAALAGFRSEMPDLDELLAPFDPDRPERRPKTPAEVREMLRDMRADQQGRKLREAAAAAKREAREAARGGVTVRTPTKPVKRTEEG